MKKWFKRNTSTMLKLAAIASLVLASVAGQKWC